MKMTRGGRPSPRHSEKVIVVLELLSKTTKSIHEGRAEVQRLGTTLDQLSKWKSLWSLSHPPHQLGSQDWRSHCHYSPLDWESTNISLIFPHWTVWLGSSHWSIRFLSPSSTLSLCCSSLYQRKRMGGNYLCLKFPKWIWHGDINSYTP